MSAARCFSLVFFITALVTMTFTDLTFLSTPLELTIGSGWWKTTVSLSDLKPSVVTLPPVVVNYSSTAASIELNGTVHAAATAKVSVSSILGHETLVTPVKVTVTGGLELTKDGSLTSCASNNIAVKSCTLAVKLDTSLTQRLPGIDLCGSVETAVLNGLKPAADVALPTPVAGSSNIAQSSYFQSLRLKALASTFFGASNTAVFRGKNAIRLTYTLLAPITLDVDSANWSTTPISRLLWRLIALAWWKLQQALKLPTLSQLLSAEVTTALGDNVTVRLGDSDDFLADLINSTERLYLQSYVPKAAALSFDLVANDLRCYLFGFVCTIPAGNGLLVYNVRVTGLGDADAIFTSVVSPIAGEILNRTLTDIMALKATTAFGRVYLRSF